jgi:hypothetical protein
MDAMLGRLLHYRRSTRPARYAKPGALRAAREAVGFCIAIYQPPARTPQPHDD